MIPEELEYRIVEDRERSQWLKGIADEIAGWCTPSSTSIPEWKIARELQQHPDAKVVVTPEGYGKSFLVAHLLARGFKVIFCSKANVQLLAKEREFTEGWPRNAEAIRLLPRMPVVERWQSKAQHLQSELETLGIGPRAFRLPSYETESPYGIAAVNETEAVSQLATLFDQEQLAVDAETFFEEHYRNFTAPPVDGSAVDVILMTFAAFHAICQQGRPWWHTLGLVESTEKRTIEVRGEEKIVFVRRPFKNVAVLIDDPDRGDVDWLRRVSAQTAKSLVDRRIEAADKAAIERDTRIVRKNETFYEERPADQRLGYRFKPANKRSRFRPKMIVTTTETVTTRYALKTLTLSGLKVQTDAEVFKTPICNVTAIQTTITRRRNHAVLLPIVELLREEFPEQKVALIADGLHAEFNLSNNKGRNDLLDCTTIIKLSWPHPNIVATARAHRVDLDEFEPVKEPVVDPDLLDAVDLGTEHLGSYDEMVAVLLGDLANQALGRNQGFRFRDKEAILLIDSKWYPGIVRHGVLRYRLTPWSSELPSFNRRTSKKSVWDVLLWHGNNASPLQRRLIELIRTFEDFGLSPEASRLVEKLPVPQQDLFRSWVDKQKEERLKMEGAQAEQRRKNTEAVRRHREKKRLSTQS